MITKGIFGEHYPDIGIGFFQTKQANSGEAMKKKIAVIVFVASVIVVMLLLKSHRSHQRVVYLGQAKSCMQDFGIVFKVIDDDNRTYKAFSEALKLGIADYSTLNSTTTLRNESRREIDLMVENLQKADTKWSSSEESFRKKSEDHQNEMSIAMKTMEAEIQWVWSIFDGLDRTAVA